MSAPLRSEPSGAALIPLISDGKWYGYVLGLLAAYAGGFVATFFFGIPKEQLEKEALAEETIINEPVASTVAATNMGTSEITLTAVADGTVEPLENASDPVFSQKMMGEGYFVEPVNGQIYLLLQGRSAQFSQQNMRSASLQQMAWRSCSIWESIQLISVANLLI